MPQNPNQSFYATYQQYLANQLTNGIIVDELLQGNQNNAVLQAYPEEGNMPLETVPPLQAYLNSPTSMKKNKVRPDKITAKSMVADLYGVPNLGGDAYHPDFVQSDVLLGVEVEVENWNGQPLSRWSNKPDNSLRNNGQEFVTGPVTAGQLQPRLALLCDRAVEDKWQANSRTGIHIHMNMSNQPLDFLVTFVACYLAAERTLFKYAGEWRRWCNFCHPLEEATEPLLHLKQAMSGDKLDPGLITNIGKYAGLNLASLANFGTVEVRILPTTFNYQEIAAWINALLSIYEVALDVYKQNVKVATYIKSVGVDRFAERVFFSTKTGAVMFADSVNLSDIKRAIPRIRWLEALANANTSLHAENTKKLLNSFRPKEAQSPGRTALITCSADSKLHFREVTAALTEDFKERVAFRSYFQSPEENPKDKVLAARKSDNAFLAALASVPAIQHFVGEV
jgi:hypothetical protein